MSVTKVNMHEIIKSCSVDNELYSVKYSNIDTPVAIKSNSLTHSSLISCVMDVTNKITRQSIRTTKELLEMPIKDSMGYKIDGTYYAMVGIDKRATGWYITKVNTPNGKEPLMEFIPSLGCRITMGYSYGAIHVILGSPKRKGKVKVNLGVFLKALIGKSFTELIMILGPTNKAIVSTLVDEPSRDECINIVLSALTDKLGHLSTEHKYKELLRRIYPQSVKATVNKDRLRLNTSFLNRALNKELAKDVLTYKKGCTLTPEILKDIDSSDVNTLFVIHDNTRYELKKYSIPDEDLSENELYTVSNMFACVLNNYDTLDDRYDLSNRRIGEFEDTIIDNVIDKLQTFNDVISDHFIFHGEQADVSKINLYKVNVRDLIENIKIDSKHSQTADCTNILSIVANEGKITSDFSGRASEDMIAVKDTEKNSYDPFQIPESKKVGLVHTKTINCEVDDNGELTAPFIKLDNGVIVSEEPVYLSPSERKNRYIASCECDLSSDLIRCSYNEVYMDVPKEKLDYIEYSVLNLISFATSGISFMNHSDGKRLVMGGNQGRQALVTVKTEAPKVRSGVLHKLGRHKVIVSAKTVLIDNYLKIHNKVSCSYEEFIEKEIRLVTSDTTSNRKLIFEVEDNGNILTLEYVIPYCVKSINNSLYQYNLLMSPTLTYKGDDIIAHDIGVDIKKYNLDYLLDYGFEKPPAKEELDYELAIGNNYRVAWKTYSSANVDDGITINASILGSDKLAHITIYEIKAELKSDADEVEKFGLTDKIDTHDKNGMPKVGVILKPKSLAIGKICTKSGESQRNTSVYLDSVTEGQVIKVSRDEKYARVYLACRAEVELGDKLAGSHGNKGVIAKIVPESWMGFDEDGNTIDIYLNPLGIPSRMNISQLLEGALGYALELSGEDRAVVMSPFYKDALKVVQGYGEKYDVKPIRLRDGRTGKLFDRPTTVGIVHLKKLSHTVKSKSNSTGIPSNVNPVTLQGKKGKKVEGGQALGEMEMHALLSANCPNVVQELFSLQSDDVNNRNKLARYLEHEDDEDFTFDLKGENHNDDSVLALARSLCIDLKTSEDGSRYELAPLLDKDITRLSRKPIQLTRESLQDPEIFGVIDTPRQIAEARKKWSYIKLDCEIVSPIWIYKSKLANMLIVTHVELKDGFPKTTINKLNRKNLADIIDNKAFLCEKNGNMYFLKEPIKGYDTTSGMHALVNLFKWASLDDALSFYSKALEDGNESNNGISDKDKFNLCIMINSIRNLIDGGFKLSDFVIQHYPIMPRTYRIPVMDRSSDFDKLYTSIITSVKLSKGLGNATAVYKQIVAFMGLSSSKSIADKSTRTLLEFFNGKDSDTNKGFIREKMISKIIFMSARSAIIPAEAGLLKPTEIGVPFSFVCNCLEKPILSKVKKYLNDKYDSVGKVDARTFMSAMINEDLVGLGKCLNISTGLEDLYKSLKNLIINYAESRVVLSGRQPTLHEFGIRAFVVKVVSGNALRLHPLTCSAYNADFDGDQMWLAFLVTKQAISEALKNLSPTTKMINSKDNSFVLEPTQDVILGCYLRTMLHGNVMSAKSHPLYTMSHIRYYDDISIIEHDIHFGLTRSSDLAMLNINGVSYLSTAGRIYFNSIIPNGFTDEPYTNNMELDFINESNSSSLRNLRYDGLAKKSVKDSDPKAYSISSIIDYVHSIKDNSTLVTFLDDVFKFGVYCCDNSGITLGLGDFIEHPELDELIRKSTTLVGKIHKHYELGLLSADSRKRASTKIYDHVTKYVKSTLLKFYDRDNNLFIIIDSGARGNISQLMKTCGLVGTVSKTNSETLETPVMSNYLRGLKPSDVMLIAYGTRVGVATVQNDTAKAGELTRKAVYTLCNFRIVESDCGKTKTPFKVLYDDEITGITLNGTPIDVSELVGLTISGEDEKIVNYETLSGDCIDSSIIYYIKKHRIKKLITSAGEVKIKYRLSKLFKSMMLDRESENLPHLYSNSFISSETLKHIEEENLEFINVRTMLTCNSRGGVCAHCYGLKTDNKRYPQVGDMIGISAAQALGESSTQLTLDTINKGGAADGNVNGVSLFKAYVQGSVPGKGTRAIVAQVSDKVSVIEQGKNLVILQIGGIKHSVDKSSLKVMDNEMVSKGDILTDGILDVNSIESYDTSETIVKRQIALLELLYSIYINNNVELCARNFEILVRAQTALVRILESSDPKYPAGSIQFYEDVKDLDNVSFYHNIESTENVINKFAGFTTNMSYVNFTEFLASSVLNPDRTACADRSFFGKLLIGEDVSATSPKKLDRPSFVGSTVSESNNFKTEDATDFSKLITIEKAPNSFEGLANLDLSDGLFDDLLVDDLKDANIFDDVEPEKPSNESYINTETKRSNLF